MGPLNQWEASILSSQPIRSLDFGQILIVSKIWSRPIQHQFANWLLFQFIDSQKDTNWMSISKAFSIDCYSNSLTIDCQFNANWLLMECLLDSNWLPTDFQLESHFGGPRLHSTASSQPMAPRSFPSIEGNNRGARGWDEFIPIQYKLTANWMSIDCQLNPIQIDSQLNVNSLPIECQLVKIHLNLRLLGRFPL